LWRGCALGYAGAEDDEGERGLEVAERWFGAPGRGHGATGGVVPNGGNILPKKLGFFSHKQKMTTNLTASSGLPASQSPLAWVVIG
jgi:hypothetical protein